jgi:hypothetical protein
MANGILSILRGMVGSSDGTTTGTPSVWKVASGVGSVVSTTADALLTTIAARLLSSANVSAADLLGFVRTAVEKLATETAVGDGLAVRQATAGKLNVTEASAADIKAAVEKLDDWDAVHDAAAGTDGVRLMGTAYADPSTLPADVSADGDGVRVATSRKGETYVYQSRLGFGEDSSRDVVRVERQGTETGRSAASAAVVAAGTAGRILGHVLEAGAGGATFNVRKDGVVGGAIIAQFVLAANTYDLRDWPDWPYGNGLYCEIAAGGGAFNFVVRNT